MPEMDGIETTRQIKRESPNTCVLIITTHETPDYVLAALEAGAAGYLLKDVTRPDLLSTISRVLRGESILGAEMAVRMMQRLAQSKGHAEGPSVERLTPREQEVLQFVVEGQTNREIAARMSLSVGTIKIHVEHIIGKLGVSDRTQAAVHAVRYGLVHGGPGDKR
jgi:DNA-binding NarL/FixJ family response regulator